MSDTPDVKLTSALQNVLAALVEGQHLTEHWGAYGLRHTIRDQHVHTLVKKPTLTKLSAHGFIRRPENSRSDIRSGLYDWYITDAGRAWLTANSVPPKKQEPFTF